MWLVFTSVRRCGWAGRLCAGLEQREPLLNILHSEYEWRQVRKIHIELQPKCQMCGMTRLLEVHHVIPWHMSPVLRFSPSNLLTLCRECHFRFGHLLDWQGMNPMIRELCDAAQSLNVTIVS